LKIGVAVTFKSVFKEGVSSYFYLGLLL